MRVVLLNTFDAAGGSVRACERLLRGLTTEAIDTTMLVREKGSNGVRVQSVGSRTSGIFRALIDGALLHLYPRRKLNFFAPAWAPGRALREIIRLSPDIVHLHWVVNGFVRIESLAKFSVPIVWTLHDSWPFTGGCHLPGECNQYEQSCGWCPILGSKREHDMSRWIWYRKKKAWHDISVTIIAPSRWIAERARSSSLFRGRNIVVIPNAIDTGQYAPGDKLGARRELGLSERGNIILFGANHALNDHNKGFDLLRAALTSAFWPETQLVVFGAPESAALPECGLHVRNFGFVHDERKMALLYQSADVFVAPSRDENLPYVVMEAMACGTPCVAFRVGGMEDLITHYKTGLMARPFDTGELAARIQELLHNDSFRMELADNARRWVVNNVNMKRIAQRHIELYQQLILAATCERRSKS